MGKMDSVDKKIRPSERKPSPTSANPSAASERERLKNLILTWLNGPQKDPKG
jgi:hypothetical protein